MPAATVVVLYHSGYGKTKIMAEHVLAGVRAVPGVEARLMTADEALKDLAPLTAADCIIFGSPTYMGSMAARLKEVLEAASKIWYVQGWRDKLAAGFTNSQGPSGDKLNTLQSLWINAMQHGMLWIGTGMIPGAEGTGGTDHELNRLSGYAGAMAQSPMNAQAPLPADLHSAERFGRRVAEATVRWVRGKA